MAKRRMNPEDIASLMGSPEGADFDRRASERDQIFNRNETGEEGSALSQIEGPGVNKVHQSTPILDVRVNERYRNVPINAPKVYADWRASKGDESISHWHELSGESQVDWQQRHPEGKVLTARAIAHAKANPEEAMGTEEGSGADRKQASLFRSLVRNMVAEPNTDPSTWKIHGSHVDEAPLHQRFRERGELLTGKYVGGGTSADNPRENLDQTPEVSLGRAWVAGTTSRPEIGMALHDDPSHHENMRNAVDALMQDHAQSIGGAAYGSEVAKHGRLALEAVARSARAHSLGMKATALANMSQAVRNINDLATAVKGAKMSAGIPVAATPSPEVMNAGKAYGAYNASVANVKGLPE